MPKLTLTNGNDTITVPANFDEVEALAGNDRVTTSNGKSTINGGADHDWISTGNGKDTLNGGTGDDILIGGAGADQLNGDIGFDTASYATALAGVAVSFSNTDASGIGGLYASLSKGGYAGDASGDSFSNLETFSGSDFADRIGGGETSMSFSLGKGDDVFDTNFSINVSDTVSGGDGNDTAWGGNGNDVLSGDAGNDVLLGETGDDTLNGGAGSDKLNGGAGADTADYLGSGSGVTVNLASGTGQGGMAEGDTLDGIENVAGSNSADALGGDAAANVLSGNGGDDTLSGRAGADTLVGGSGSDTADYSASGSAVAVDLGAGTASGGDAAGDALQSIENVTGSALGDVLTGNAGGNVLSGGDGADSLDGGDGHDTLMGGGANDVFLGGLGNDTHDGGAGQDTVDYRNAAGAVALSLAAGGTGGAASGDSYTGIENVLGSIFGDEIDGDAGSNEFTAGKGDDDLSGGDGDDTLLGGDGNDRLDGGAGADRLTGGMGTDTADYRSASAAVTASLVASGNGDAAGDSYSSIENLSGSNFDDVLTGDDGVNRLVGRQGADTLEGRGGNDVLVGGGGYDTLDGGSGIDTADYSGSWGLVWVNLATGKGSGAEAAKDVLSNIENVNGSGFDDILTGDSQVNRLAGAGGNDALKGGGGNDVLVGGAGADALDGGTGDRDAADYQSARAAVTVNLVSGGTGGEAAGDSYVSIEYVYGSAFDDAITGNDAVNRLAGNGGNDILDGAKGNDYLVGGAGDDTMTGGEGHDVFEFSGLSGNDTISDFAAGAGRTDRIWFTDSGLADFADVLAHARDSAGGVVIDINGQGSITLAGVTVAALTADDFLFG